MKFSKNNIALAALLAVSVFGVVAPSSYLNSIKAAAEKAKANFSDIKATAEKAKANMAQAQEAIAKAKETYYKAKGAYDKYRFGTTPAQQAEEEKMMAEMNAEARKMGLGVE